MEIKELSQEVSSKFDKIVKTIDNFINQTKNSYSEILNDFRNKTSEINGTLNSTVSELQNTNSEVSNLSSNIIAYLDEVKQINFPFRFDKLDATVLNINQAIQNLQGRLESAVKDIREDVTVHSNDMKSKLKYSFAEMVSKLMKHFQSIY